MYLFATNAAVGKSVEVTIPLSSKDGSTQIQKYTATRIGGVGADSIEGTDSITLTIPTDDVLVYKITPTETPAIENVDYKLGSECESGIELNAAEVHEVSIEEIGVLTAEEDYTYDPESGVLRFTEAFLEEKNNGGLEPGEYVVSLTYDNTTAKVMLKIEAEHLNISADKSDLSFQKGDEAGAKLYCSGAFARFRGIRKDGAEVSAEHYTAEKGSTVITFTKAYMESLSEGEHTFELVFRDGSIPAKVVITAAEGNKDQDNTTGTDNPSDTKDPSGSGKPTDSDTEDTSDEGNTEASVEASASEAVGSTATATGDSSQPVLWLLLAILSTMTGAVILTGKRNKR